MATVTISARKCKIFMISKSDLLDPWGGDVGKLYVTTAGFSSGFNYLGTDNNIEEQGPCQGLLLGGATLPPPFWGCESHGRDGGVAGAPPMAACYSATVLLITRSIASK